MSKVTLALGSFIVGACCMFLALSGNHTSTFAQNRFMSRIDAAVPTVPSIQPFFLQDSSLRDTTLSTDGVRFSRNTFENVTLEYGGGLFAFDKCKFNGPIRVSLTGAAANTFALIQFLQAIEAGRHPKPVEPRAPILQLAQIKQPTTANLISPYGQK